MLYKKKIKGNQNISTDQLTALQRQKPNRRVLGYPIYVWFYYWGQNTSDKTRIESKIKKVREKFDVEIAHEKDGNQILKLKKKRENKLAHLKKKLEKGSLFMRIIRPAAEAPEIYQDKLSQQTVQQMRLYMHSKGYFDSEAKYIADTSRKRVKVTYLIKENLPHKLSEISYTVEDSSIENLIKKRLKYSFLKTGENYDVSNFSKERDRIEKLLKDNGYYDFSRQYIDFEYDSTVANYTSDSINNILGKRRVDVEVIIHNPETGNHKIYKIDSINFTIEGTNNLTGLARQHKYLDGITFHYFKDNYSRKILNYKVFLRPGEKYSYRNTLETQRQLINLDNFKFVNVSYDTVAGKFIGRITANPSSKYTTTEELGFSISQRVPGPTTNVSFKIRNVFKGLENFESGIRYTFEGVASGGSNKNIYRSQEVTASASLIFPQTLFPFPPKFKRDINRFNPKTRVISSYTFINRPQYNRSNLKGSVIYSWQKGLYTYFNLTPVDLNIYTTNLTPGTSLYDSIKGVDVKGEPNPAGGPWKIKQNPLYYAFQTAFVSGISGSYSYSDYFPGLRRISKAMIINLESGGTIFNLLKERFPNDNFFNYRYFTYLRLTADFRYYKPLAKKSLLASRLYFGIARPYLTEKKALPYEKYFFAGGSSSIRAWKPRQLGPGSYTDTAAFSYFHYGDILLEMNVEYRFNIFWIFDGAVFVDAGNVWAYYKDTNRENGHFEWNRFYNEIAVGSGIGLRLNLSFLVVRLDAAYKVYDPSKPLANRVVVHDAVKEPYKAANFNIGINYPF